MLASLLLSAGAVAAAPLVLDDVLQSAESAYPLLLAAIKSGAWRRARP